MPTLARPSKKRRVQVADPPKSPDAQPRPTSPDPAAHPPPAPKDTPEPPAPQTTPTTFKIIAGSYEKLLYGLEATVAPDGGGVTLRPIFMFPAHVAAVKAVAASPAGGKWLATGSADEVVKIWDLRRLKEVGGLVHHTGSITHLTFASRSHLLSASEDGTLCVFRARDWAVLRTLRGHTGAVAGVAVHPSGKLALSVGADRTLRMWDLLRGRGAASTKLAAAGERVCWSPAGARFAVQARATVDLFSTSMALQHTIAHPARVHDVQFFRPAPDPAAPDPAEFLLVAAEDKKVTVYALHADRAPTAVAALVGHTNRVKAVATHARALACTVSSDGVIRVFDLARGALARGGDIAPVAEYDTRGSRLICVAVADGDAAPAPAGKRKRGAAEGAAAAAE